MALPVPQPPWPQAWMKPWRTSLKAGPRHPQLQITTPFTAHHTASTTVTECLLSASPKGIQPRPMHRQPRLKKLQHQQARRHGHDLVMAGMNGRAHFRADPALQMQRTRAQMTMDKQTLALQLGEPTHPAAGTVKQQQMRSGVQ